MNENKNKVIAILDDLEGFLDFTLDNDTLFNKGDK
jgi:hypothetical protein